MCLLFYRHTIRALWLCDEALTVSCIELNHTAIQYLIAGG